MVRSLSWTSWSAWPASRVWRLNDSEQPRRGSSGRCHEGIGAAGMGLGPFRHVLNDPRFRAIPMVLETPKGTEEGMLDAINLRPAALEGRPRFWV